MVASNVDESNQAERSPRAAQFAEQFASVNNEMIACVTQCSDDDWRATCADEGWPVGVVAHHVASVLPAFMQFVDVLASGDALPPRISMDKVNQNNAQHAQDYGDVGKSDVLDLLRTHGPSVVQLLSGLSESQLEHSSTAFGGRELSVAQLVEMVVIGHSRIHLASMQRAIAG